ncbi:hypothetical protein KIL84_006640 [Mauremys mutica]|uniref:Uncharacterized protein n=1 Tax=Mauremys mutica TaxID=74926 RepID=A0A9D3WZQ9_9SAUR|nr:hypothetical protein KIL84_006640 [Mauremys mutica]
MVLMPKKREKNPNTKPLLSPLDFCQLVICVFVTSVTLPKGFSLCRKQQTSKGSSVQPPGRDVDTHPPAPMRLWQAELSGYRIGSCLGSVGRWRQVGVFLRGFSLLVHL